MMGWRDTSKSDSTHIFPEVYYATIILILTIKITRAILQGLDIHASL
jgi:hypothetical protein